MRSRTRGPWVGGIGMALFGLAAGFGPVPTATAAVVSLDAMYSCTGGLASPITIAVSASAPDRVPEDFAALVSVVIPFGPLAAAAGPGATVVKAELTFALEDPVGDIDLRFGPGSIAARDWDARGGQQVVVSFVPEQPVPVGAGQLPGLTEVFTFDPHSAGQVVTWRSFRTINVTFDEAGTSRVVTCQAVDQQATIGQTLIDPPTAPHETVIKATDAVGLASNEGTTGLPAGYVPGASPTTSATSSGRPTGTSRSSTTVSGAVTGTSIAADGSVVAVGDGGGDGGAPSDEVAAGEPISDSSSRSWTWAIIVLGLASAAALVVIMVRGHREPPPLGLGDDDAPR